MKTFVYIDHFKGEIQPASWEALGLGKKFGLGERGGVWFWCAMRCSEGRI